jgi:hypothetical protein
VEPMPDGVEQAPEPEPYVELEYVTLSYASTLPCKPAQRIRNMHTETTTALTARRHSLEKRRKWANPSHGRPRARSTTTLHCRKRRTGSSGNIYRYWG